MFRSVLIVLACMAGMAGFAVAQDTGDLSLGQSVGPQIGDTYVADIKEDWEVRCVKAPEGQKDRCHIYQLLKRVSGDPIAEISLFALPNPGEAVAGATIITPLETMLQQGLQISVDNAEPKIYPFSYCNQIGCFSRAGFTGPDLFAMERGTSATITISALNAPDKPIGIFVSLAGFTDAYDALFD